MADQLSECVEKVLVDKCGPPALCHSPVELDKSIKEKGNVLSGARPGPYSMSTSA